MRLSKKMLARSRGAWFGCVFSGGAGLPCALSACALCACLLSAALWSSVSLAQPADRPDAAQGEALFNNGDLARGLVSCASCHGAGGNSMLPINPNLAAQPYEYLVKQLLSFRPKDAGSPAAVPATRRGADGADSLMTPFANLLSEAEIRNVAYYLSLQKQDEALAATATNEATMERGQKIWRGGLPERNVPACAGCHGPTGAGIAGEYPRLAGQFPSYLAEQLKLFRSGDRANAPMMHDIGDRMSDADIAAVADYAAGLR